MLIRHLFIHLQARAAQAAANGNAASSANGSAPATSAAAADGAGTAQQGSDAAVNANMPNHLAAGNGDTSGALNDAPSATPNNKRSADCDSDQQAVQKKSTKQKADTNAGSTVNGVAGTVEDTAADNTRKKASKHHKANKQTVVASGTHRVNVNGTHSNGVGKCTSSEAEQVLAANGHGGSSASGDAQCSKESSKETDNGDDNQKALYAHVDVSSVLSAMKKKLKKKGTMSAVKMRKTAKKHLLAADVTHELLEYVEQQVRWSHNTVRL